MNFKKYFLLAEEIKQPDIIDLYIMMAMPTPEDPKYKAIYDDVFRRVVKEIKLEIQNIVLRELRHAPNMANIHNDKELKTLFPNQDIDPYAIRTSLTMLPKIWSSLRETSIDEFAEKTGVPWTIDSIIAAFNNLDWGYMYGGENWAKIAEQAKNLLEAGPGDTIEALDRFVDFVHNTGAVANKFKGYKEGWLNYILDLKAQSKNIRELIPYASYEVRQLFRDPSWRNMMMSMPGFGAAESDQIIVDMFRKFVPDMLKGFKWFETWISTQDDLDDQADDVEEVQYGLSHLKMLRLINEYGMDRVVNAINKAKETDPEINKLVKELIKVPNDNIHVYDSLNKQQEEFLKGLGWKDIEDVDDEDDEGEGKDYFKPKNKTAKKKPGWGSKVPKGKAAPIKGKLAKKKPLQSSKNTFYDKNRDEWVQTKKYKKQPKPIYKSKDDWRQAR